MRYLSIISALVALATCNPVSSQQQHPLDLNPPIPPTPNPPNSRTNITTPLFAELEELSRIVDIAYCVGSLPGVTKPFGCASRCGDFPSFELVETFNTGPLMADSCGFVALDHRSPTENKGRIIVAFRGTYSLANTIVDLSTVPQEYVPYPDGDVEDEDSIAWLEPPLPHAGQEPVRKGTESSSARKCENCTVHSGFWRSWSNTRALITPHIKTLRQSYPDYQLHLVGHSLGGAVALLAGLEFDGAGYEPTVTTFGEPRVGNAGLRDWVDWRFGLGGDSGADQEDEGREGGKGGGFLASRYRRVTHVDDPVPLLPLREWGYRSHAGEVYISKASLQPSVSDVRLCFGDEDPRCTAGAEGGEGWFGLGGSGGINREGEGEGEGELDIEGEVDGEVDGEGKGVEGGIEKRWGVPIPSRYKMWQLFFAHRDYFWRLGLCVPGGDPLDWGRGRYDFGDGNENQETLS